MREFGLEKVGGQDGTFQFKVKNRFLVVLTVARLGIKFSTIQTFLPSKYSVLHSKVNAYRRR